MRFLLRSLQIPSELQRGERRAGGYRPFRYGTFRSRQGRPARSPLRSAERAIGWLACALLLTFGLHAPAAADDTPRLQSVARARLGDPPAFPPSSTRLFPEERIEAAPADGFVIDAQDREAVRAFYRGM